MSAFRRVRDELRGRLHERVTNLVESIHAARITFALLPPRVSIQVGIIALGPTRVCAVILPAARPSYRYSTWATGPQSPYSGG